MSKILVSVTQTDIDAGIKGNCEKCPVARAVARCFPGNYVSVTDYTIDIFDGYDVDAELKTSFYTPTKAECFIHNFDDGQPVTPFEFVLDTEENNIEDESADFDDTEDDKEDWEEYDDFDYDDECCEDLEDMQNPEFWDIDSFDD